MNLNYRLEEIFRAVVSSFDDLMDIPPL